MEYKTLSNGIKMPVLGYGVYQVTKAEAEGAFRMRWKWATARLIRHRVISTKRKLGMQLQNRALRALEEFYEKGILKAIGISNFYADRMVEFASFNRIKPMVNQVECHPLNQQIEAKKWNDKYGIQLEAWAPFGEGRGGLFENPVLKEIAAAHGKTTAQVMLRWHLQRGIVVIPKSTHKERMAENLNVFDFTLIAEEMAKITALDTATSSFFSHQDPAMVEWFVKMVEERKKQQDSSKEKKA